MVFMQFKTHMVKNLWPLYPSKSLIDLSETSSLSWTEVSSTKAFQCHEPTFSYFHTCWKVISSKFFVTSSVRGLGKRSVPFVSLSVILSTLLAKPIDVRTQDLAQGFSVYAHVSIYQGKRTGLQDVVGVSTLMRFRCP